MRGKVRSVLQHAGGWLSAPMGGRLNRFYRFEAIVAMVAVLALPTAVVLPALLAAHQPVQAAVPTPAPSPSESPSPSPTPDQPTALYGNGATGSGGYVVGHPGCGPVPLMPPPVVGSYFPRIVIPSVHINLELHEGDGQAPPDHVWVAWHYPGTSQPGSLGNSYIYAHAHGEPPNSAVGLFWPLHYMHMCDAVYIMNSPTDVMRYQTASLNFNWPATDTRPFNQTGDERLTLQTCNGWGNYDPKTIVVAERIGGTPPPPPPPANGGGGSGGGGGSAPPPPSPSPSPSPSPLPIPVPVP